MAWKSTNGWNTYYYTLGGRLIGSLAAGGASVKGDQMFGPYGKGRCYFGDINTAKGFTGQYNDGTGLDYYGARYYDPKVGMFLTADSVQGNLAGMDPYAYVGGNPETNTDPSGRAIIGANGETYHPGSPYYLQGGEAYSISAPGKPQPYNGSGYVNGWRPTQGANAPAPKSSLSLGDLLGGLKIGLAATRGLFSGANWFIYTYFFHNGVAALSSFFGAFSSSLPLVDDEGILEWLAKNWGLTNTPKGWLQQSQNYKGGMYGLLEEGTNWFGKVADTAGVIYAAVDLFLNQSSNKPDLASVAGDAMTLVSTLLRWMSKKDDTGLRVVASLLAVGAAGACAISFGNSLSSSPPSMDRRGGRRDDSGWGGGGGGFPPFSMFPALLAPYMLQPNPDS